LRYGLQVFSGPSPDAVRLENGELMLTIPAVDARAWATRDEEIGLYYDQKLAGGGSLRIMIEKDFQCIDGPPEEIDPAGYPNPLVTSGRKPVDE